MGEMVEEGDDVGWTAPTRARESEDARGEEGGGLRGEKPALLEIGRAHV